MTTLRPSTLLAALPLILAAGHAADELTFHPAANTEATRNYGVHISFEVQDLEVSADGQDLTEMLPSDIEAKIEMMMKITDRFVRTEDGKPLELIRSFLDMEGHSEGMGESESIDGFDNLEGKAVRFAWNEEDGDYDLSYHESEGEAEWLDSLSIDMDMRSLLPQKGVSEGDTWSVDPRELESILLFGSKMNQGSGENAEFEQIFESAIKPQLMTLLEGCKVQCTYKGAREEGGVRVGAVAIAIHAEGNLDLAELISQAVQAQEADVDITIDTHQADLKMGFESEGQLLWDLASGRLHGFRMDGDVTMGVVVDISAEAMGESHALTAEGNATGKVRWNVDPTE